MAAGNFSVGERFTREGVQYRVIRTHAVDSTVTSEDLSSGKIETRALSDLLAEWMLGTLTAGVVEAPARELMREALEKVHFDRFKQEFTSVQQEMARARLHYVRALKAQPRTRAILLPLIAEIHEIDAPKWEEEAQATKPPGFSVVLKWMNAYTRADNDIRALVPRHGKKGTLGARLQAEVLEEMDDLIDTCYLTLERPTVQSVLNDLRARIARKNALRLPSQQLEKPGLRAFRRRISELPKYDVSVARFGKRIADLRFRTAGMGPVAKSPLARASMDHCRLDVFVVDEESRLPLGRPWLTLILDEYSRLVLGYFIGFEEPSAVSMSRALRNAIQPKGQLEHARQPWDAWGLMDLLVVDNGLEFHGKVLEAGAGRFGIAIQFCPRKAPWYKGKIERYFGTINTGFLVDKQGKTFSNVLFKEDYDPSEHAIMTLATLRQALEIWIVDIYHHSPHRGLERRTPAQVWAEGIAAVDRFLPPSSLAFDSAFSASCKRQLSHKGIEFDGLFYNSDELGDLRRLHGAVLEVECRIQDEDLGSMIVVFPDGVTLLRVPALDVDYALGLTRWQHKICRRYQRRLSEDDARDISLLEAKERIKELIFEDMRSTKRKSRKRQSRFTGGGKRDPAPVHTAQTVQSTAPAEAQVPEAATSPASKPIPSPTVPAPVETIDELPARRVQPRSAA